MTISHITELLKRVTDPVTRGNIIASLLVKDLKAGNSQVSFTLVLIFTKVDLIITLPEVSFTVRRYAPVSNNVSKTAFSFVVPTLSSPPNQER